MAQLLDCSAEILHKIFLSVVPTDLAALSKTCKTLNSFIKTDDLLWKLQYHQRFEPPISITGKPISNWQSRLKRLVDTEKILESENEKLKDEKFEQVVTDALDLLTAPRSGYSNSSDEDLNAEFVKHHFSTPSNISAFLCRSSLFSRCRYRDDEPAPTEELCQLSAKLHVFSGLDVEPTFHEGNRHHAAKVHPCARSRVYDLRRYDEDLTYWGPFIDNGSYEVDWEKMQAIMIDLHYNLRLEEPECPHRIYPSYSRAEPDHIWNKPFEGLSPNTYRSKPLEGPITALKDEDIDLNARDPYGVTGTWQRIVCFLDYNDLYAFNFENEPIADNEEREPISNDEAFRLITLAIRVTSIEPPGPDDHPDWPVVHFAGTSRAPSRPFEVNANSGIRGQVRTTPQGAIHWTSLSIIEGSPRWRSEGIQLGGLRSSRGILGNWFDKDYDEQGPCGPTGFWKISDDILVVDDDDDNDGVAAGFEGPVGGRRRRGIGGNGVFRWRIRNGTVEGLEGLRVTGGGVEVWGELLRLLSPED